MEKWTFLKLASEVIASVKKPLSAGEIWEYAQRKDWDRNVQSKGKTPIRTIYAAVYLDIENRGLNSMFSAHGSNPRKWYLRALPPPSQKEVQSLPDAPGSKYGASMQFSEADLYPYLRHFVRTALRAHSKTIRHTTSRKGGFSEWIHPDLVACHFAHDDWKDTVTELNTQLSGGASHTYSFELKKMVSYANLREVFFQAVSNSSWANAGYLVAAEISEDPDFRKDLERLSSAFGIGVIQLDLHDPNNSYVIFSSRERESLDWDTINMLAERNPDFDAFLKALTSDLRGQRTSPDQYDKLPSQDELSRFVTQTEGSSRVARQRSAPKIDLRRKAMTKIPKKVRKIG